MGGYMSVLHLLGLKGSREAPVFSSLPKWTALGGHGGLLLPFCFNGLSSLLAHYGKSYLSTRDICHDVYYAATELKATESSDQGEKPVIYESKQTVLCPLS